MDIKHKRCDSCLDTYLDSENKITRLKYKDKDNTSKYIDLCDECLEKITCHKTGESASMYFIKQNQ